MIKLTPLRIAVIGLTALVLAGVFFNSRTTGEMLLNRSGATTVINDATLATTTFNTPVKTTNSDLARSLIGHWTFDGKNLTQNIADSSSYGNEAYIYGGTTTIAGKFGQALSFDKNLLQYAEVSTTTEITANQDFTFSAWVRTTMAQTGSTWPIILSKDSQSTRKGYDLAIYNSTVSPLWYLDAYTSPSTGYIVYGASNIPDGDWHHLGAGREGSVLFAYEDGLFVATSSASAADMTDAASDLTFGRSPENTDSRFYYTGDIDDVRFWSRALSAGDVCRLYELGGKPTVDSSVRRDSHWTFDLVDIPVNITDTAGNGHTGYLFLGGNNPATTTVTGVFGEALRFNGTTNYVNVPSYTMPTENGSLSFWFYLNESTSDAPLFTSRLVSPLRIFDFFFSSGTLFSLCYNKW